MIGIDKATRLSNYLIDLAVIVFLWILFIIVLGNSIPENWIFYFLMFGYYLTFESITGQTLGKMLTKTHVVYQDGSKPSFFRILMRSFFRLIPFDAMSYLFGYEKGLHDLLSSTKLIKEKNTS